MKSFTFKFFALSMMALVGPAWAGNDRAEPPLRVAFNLLDGSHVIGIPYIESVPVQTSYAKIDVPLKQILSIKMSEDHETASIDLQNGDKIKGSVRLAPITLETVFGRVSIGMEHVRELRVVLAGGVLPDALKRGLVLYYSFDRDEDGKVTDVSGKKTQGEVHGAKWTAQGKVGGAYRFSGGKDHILVDCPTLRKCSSDSFSIAVWLYAEQFNPNDENTVFGISAPRGVNDGAFSYRIGIGRPNGQGTDFALGFTPGTFCRDNSVSPFMLGLKEKQWYHAVGVYDKGDIRLYVNGEEKGRTKYSLGTAGPSGMNYDRPESDDCRLPSGPPPPRGAGPPSKKPPYVVTPCRGLPYVHGTGSTPASTALKESIILCEHCYRPSLHPTPASTALMGCIGNSVGMFESRGFNGIIDELMFFDRVLSGEEVKQLYDVQK